MMHHHLRKQSDDETRDSPNSVITSTHSLMELKSTSIAKDTSSEFVRAFPMSSRGRPPLFNFSVPSKWDDAEKWLISRHNKGDAFEEKVSSFHTKHRDVGTEMTPLGTRCHTPIKIASPARHNTPTSSRSGRHSAVWINWSTREEEEEEVSKSLRHFEERKSFAADSPRAATATWEEEEEEEEDGERTKSCCIRYQRELREEARIQAWVNLQKAKAEARSRKLEVKIEKMRSDLEEKLMKRMAIVHRRAEEWKASAKLQQVQRASEQVQKIKIQHRTHPSSTCGCFPCNNHI